MKAENEQRKQNERKTVSSEEAIKISGRGGESKPYAYSDGAWMELCCNGYVDSKIRKSREEAEKLAETGKQYGGTGTGGKAES